MYVCREYSLRGNRKSQTMPMTMHDADRYGGILSNRGSFRNARIVGASMVISPMTMHHIEFAKTTNSQSSAMRSLGGSWPRSAFYRFRVEQIFTRDHDTRQNTRGILRTWCRRHFAGINLSVAAHRKGMLSSCWHPKQTMALKT